MIWKGGNITLKGKAIVLGPPFFCCIGGFGGGGGGGGDDGGGRVSFASSFFVVRDLAENMLKHVV